MWRPAQGCGSWVFGEKLTYRRRIRAPRVVETATDFELGLLVFHDANERADESFETTLRGRDSERFASASLLTIPSSPVQHTLPGS